MIRYALLLYFTLLGVFSLAQNQVKIIHSVTKKPLEKVAVYCNDNLIGYTKKDGTLSFKTKCKTVEIDTDFFQPKEVKVEKNFTVELSPTNDKVRNIRTVAIKNESDPKAMKILKQVYKNYQKNNPKSLDGYRFKQYSKISLDVDKDTVEIYRNFINKRNDSLAKIPNRNLKQSQKDTKDSLMEESFAQVGTESNFFLWEKVEQHKYSKKHGKKIVILDSKISGFNNPIYEVMALSFSILNRMPRVINPDNKHLYRYFLSDTVEIDGRKNFLIKFRQLDAKQKQNPRKFTGNLYIDTETYGVKHIEYIDKKQKTDNVTSTWKFINGKWFLESESFKFRVGNQAFNIGKAPTDPEAKDKKASTKNFGNYAFVKNRFFDFEINPTQDSKEFKGYTYSIERTDGEKIADFRTENLSEREEKAYVKVDSISKIYDFEKQVAVLTTLMKGKIRLGKVDFSLDKIIRYNPVEGFRIGLGGKLNERFSTLYSPDAYVGYGLKDRKIKYGVGVDFKLSKNKNSILRAEVVDDVTAFGAFSKNLWGMDLLLQNNGNGMYNHNFFRYQGGAISYEYDLLNSLTAKISISRQKQSATNDYQYKNEGGSFTDFSTKLTLKYSPKDKNIMTPQGKFTYETGTPIFFANIEKGVNFLGGNMDYHRIDALAKHIFRSQIGVTTATVYGGYSSATAPLWKNFEIAGNASSTKNDFLSKVNLESALAQYTMPSGTFYAEYFAGVQLRHTLPFAFKLGSRFSRITLGYNAVWGDFKHQNYHSLPLQTPKNIYQEAGITWRKFLGTVYDIGLYHRLGYYTTKKFSDNIGVVIGVDL